MAKLRQPNRNVSVTINISKELHNLLRLAAIARANDKGGRPSISGVCYDFLERHKHELEREAKRVTILSSRQ